MYCILHKHKAINVCSFFCYTWIKNNNRRINQSTVQNVCSNWVSSTPTDNTATNTFNFSILIYISYTYLHMLPGGGQQVQHTCFMPVSHRAYGLYGQVTIETIGWPGAWPCRPHWPYRFFASEQKFRMVRLTVETVGGTVRDRTRWPYLATRMASTVSCCGLYG